MLFWIFVIGLLVSIGICIWGQEKNWSVWDETIITFSTTSTILFCLAIVANLIIIVGQYTTVDPMVDKCQRTYESLVYQYENNVFDSDDDVIGKKELYNQIQDWNEDLAYHQSIQDNFWLGIYYPNIYDQFEFIEYK